MIHRETPEGLPGSNPSLRGLLPLAAISFLLSAAAGVAAGPGGVPFFDRTRALILGISAGLFLGWYAVILLLRSIPLASRFTDSNTRHVDIGRLWRHLHVDPKTGVLAFALTAYGVTGAQSLSEIYRTHADLWHDSRLWAIEEPLFLWLSENPAPLLMAWDEIYKLMWSFVLCCAVILYSARRFAHFQDLLLACVLAFYFTRSFAILFPNAGPVFYRAEYFHLEGTVSAWAQGMLSRYMAGDIPQNGLIPGTMGMPSLHIALSGMAAYSLFREWRRSAWVTLPALLLVWCSTVILGWHYLLDGVGGLMVGALSLAAAKGIRRISPAVAVSPQPAPP